MPFSKTSSRTIFPTRWRLPTSSCRRIPPKSRRCWRKTHCQSTGISRCIRAHAGAMCRDGYRRLALQLRCCVVEGFPHRGPDGTECRWGCVSCCMYRRHRERWLGMRGGDDGGFGLCVSGGACTRGRWLRWTDRQFSCDPGGGALRGHEMLRPRSGSRVIMR